MVESLKEAKPEEYLNQKRIALTRHKANPYYLHISPGVSITSQKAQEIIARDVKTSFVDHFCRRLTLRSVSTRKNLENSGTNRLGKRILITTTAPVLMLSAVVGITAAGKVNDRFFEVGFASSAAALIVGSTVTDTMLKHQQKESLKKEKGEV